MSNLRRRVGNLERAAGVPGDGWCACKRAPRVVVDWSADESGIDRGEAAEVPAICPRCGLPMRTVVLRVIYGDDLDLGEVDDER